MDNDNNNTTTTTTAQVIPCAYPSAAFADGYDRLRLVADDGGTALVDPKGGALGWVALPLPALRLAVRAVMMEEQTVHYNEAALALALASL